MATREAVLSRQTGAQIHPSPPPTLVEQQKEYVTFARHHIISVRYALEPIDQKARDIADWFLPLECYADLFPHG
jgi:hypothetical protein